MVYKKRKFGLKKLRKAVKKTKPVIPQAYKDYVAKKLDDAIEDKEISKQYDTFPLWNGFNNMADLLLANIFCLGPYDGTFGPGIVQGTSQGTRIGNRITIKKSILKFNICPQVADLETNLHPQPNLVRIVLFKVRQDADYTAVANIITNSFFNDGINDEPVSGLTIDVTKPLNKDVMTVYRDFIIKVGYEVNYSPLSYGGTVPPLTVYPSTNNDFKMSHQLTLDVTKYLPKRVHYNDNTTIPETKQCWMVILPVNYNGTAPPALGASELRAQMTHTIHYEDA